MTLLAACAGPWPSGGQAVPSPTNDASSLSIGETHLSFGDAHLHRDRDAAARTEALPGTPDGPQADPRDARGESADAGADASAHDSATEDPVPDAAPPPADSAPPAPDPIAYDFIARAPDARWHNNDGPVTWPLQIGDSRGSCMFLTETLEDGWTGEVLFAHPKWGAGGFMHAAYDVTVPAAAEKPQLELTFGFLDKADCSTGVRFNVTTRLDEAWLTVMTHTKRPTGELTSKTVDLSTNTYAGKKLRFYVNTEAEADSHCDWAVWKQARITRN